jgi:hypothetical protein
MRRKKKKKKSVIDSSIRSAIYTIISSTVASPAKNSIPKRDPYNQLPNASFFHSPITKVRLASNFLAF